MGIKITVGGYSFQALGYSVREEATPLAAGDSSGSVGTVSFTIPQPDPDLTGTQDTGWRRIRTFGENILLGEPVELSDTRKGYTLGTVEGVTRDDSGGTLTFECSSRLGDLNVYNVQAQPFIGTLGDAFDYYLSLANIEGGLFVDDTITARPVVFPGWSGELWYYLKQMAAAQDCDVSLVSGVILLRPIRVREATRGRMITPRKEMALPTLAQSVEVYLYNNREITDELVYPPGGWNPEVQVLNVNAGETSEYTLELSASVSAIQVPTMQSFVAQSESSASVYTIVANDGLPVSPTAWANNGGDLSISINPDTTTLTVTLRGATGLPTAAGEAATNFSVALASDASSNRYSTLRILGTGVAFDKVKKAVRTGIPASRTATEVGVTIDNPFISTVDDLYRAGTRAAKMYAGPVPRLSGTLTAVNRLGDSGNAQYPTYDEVETALKDIHVGPDVTYEGAEFFYDSEGLTTYGSVREWWFTFVRDDFTNQVFGNVNGARIYDRASRRWYRIRGGTISEGLIEFEADDDLTHADIESFHATETRTYGDLDLLYDGLSYVQAERLGLYGGG